MRWAVIVVVLLSACKREERAAPTAPAPPAVAAPTAPVVVAADGGGSSDVLRKFVDSPAHRKVAALAKTLLAEVEAGKCEPAVDRAKELAEGVRLLAGEFKLSGTDLKEVGRKIQEDPNYMDAPYMRYKGRLVGLSVGLDFAPMSVKLGGSVDPAAKKKACDEFVRQLREIRQP